MRCKTNYSVPADTNLTEIALKVQGRAKINVTKNSNQTYTIEICYKMQFKPRRKKRDGSYTNKSSMSNATMEYWKQYRKNTGDGSSGPPQK